jgi:catechol 2,3-dioxygenase-like lactoylglutathione lyase family enzyme
MGETLRQLECFVLAAHGSEERAMAITPYLYCEDVDRALDFLSRALGLRVRRRVEGGPGAARSPIAGRSIEVTRTPTIDRRQSGLEMNGGNRTSPEGQIEIASGRLSELDEEGSRLERQLEELRSDLKSVETGRGRETPDTAPQPVVLPQSSRKEAARLRADSAARLPSCGRRA